MADFAAALRTRLTGDTAVAAIVGDKVSWAIVPAESSPPYVRLQAIGGTEDMTLTGPDGLKRAFVTLDCFAGTHKGAWSLAQVARAALLDTVTVSGITFVRTDAELPRDAGEDIPGVGFVHLAKFNCQIDYRGD